MTAYATERAERLDDAIAARKLLESDIQALIDGFQKYTGLFVDGIHYSETTVRSSLGGPAMPIGKTVRVEVSV